MVNLAAYAAKESPKRTVIDVRDCLAYPMFNIVHIEAVKRILDSQSSNRTSNIDRYGTCAAPIIRTELLINQLASQWARVVDPLCQGVLLAFRTFTTSQRIK